MIAIFLIPVYLLVNWYIYHWLINWMGSCSKYFKSKQSKFIINFIYGFFASSLLIAFILPNIKLKRYFNLIGNYWLGVLLYVIITVVIFDLVARLLYKLKKIKKDKFSNRRFVIAGAICIVIILTVSILGVINARILRTTRYEIDINKKVPNMKDLNIVMVADLHMGYNIGYKHISKMVNMINKENADLVIIAGDIFDNDYEAIERPNDMMRLLRNIKSKYGVYAVYGNHDIKEKTLAGFTFDYKKHKVSDILMDEFLEKANIKLLRDEKTLINNNIYLYGRPDYTKLGRGITKRKTPEEITKDMKQEKPIIVIDHQPKELDELSKAGVDLDLSGHTHDGQLFPGNILTKIMWENSCGYLKKNNMHSIVTSGVGLYGPNMRVGTKPEITTIKVNFKSN